MSSKNIKYNKKIKKSEAFKNKERHIEDLLKELSEHSLKLSKIGIELLFIGNGILIFDKNENNELRAGIINIIGVTILSVAGVTKIIENSISKSPLPMKINQEKFLGIITSLIGNFILTKILFIEHNLHGSKSEVEDTLVD